MTNPKNPFSFKGRVRRTTYWITNIICSGIISVLEKAGENEISSDGKLVFLIFLLIPVGLVSYAVAAKRCHDLGHSGWWQLIPFYSLWLAFQNGKSGDNEYGPNPKGE